MTHPPVVAQPAAFDARRWAAEELALRLGWLRECPYHGEPFKSPAGDAAATRGAGDLGNQPVVDEGNVYSLALQLSRIYSERCPICTAESAVPE